MTPNLNEDIESNPSFKFEDSNEYISVTLYAQGAIEQKDIDVLTETDSLEVKTPDNERWFFHLYDHIFSDQIECSVKINENKTRTSIKLRLYKQRKNQSWPQLYSRQSIPITPNEQSKLADDSLSENQTYNLVFKKIHSEFTETSDNKALVQIFIPGVSDCEVQFTETNFTVIFSTKDEDFLREHSIPSNVPIRLFVRVKERIKTELCSYHVHMTYFEINLAKDSQLFSRWDRLEPNEYTETRSIISSSPPMGAAIMPPTNHNFNTPIALPTSRSFDRQSDRFPFQQNDVMFQSSNKTPIGYTGIYNPANSCFMNAALQCLSNTRELRDYFLNALYCAEINRTNPLGMKGIMAEEFANVIQNLWSGQSSYINANRLREYLGKRHQEFAGHGQHDAQELLTILLDALHEDLNRVLNKPQVPAVEDENLTDELLADAFWNGYLKRNDSVIVQLFTGQFKSKTKCPQCHKESVTFDPFTSLSVPIPKRIAIDIIILYRTDERAPKKFRIVISTDGTIGDLKRLLAHKADLSITKMLAYKISNRTIDYLKDEDRVSNSFYSWYNSDTIYISEILTSAECNNENIVQLTFYQRIFRVPDYIQGCAYCQASPNPQTTPKWCQKCYRVSYCDEQCQKYHANDHKTSCGFRISDNYEIVGLPFIITLPESKLDCKNIFEQIQIHAKQTVDICIKHSQNLQHQIDDNDEFEDENFEDVENMHWTNIKSTLCSSDSWSICRIGDYFAKKKRHQRETNPFDDRSSESSLDDYDMLEDICVNQPLFRLMPQKDEYLNNNQDNCQAIIDFNDTSDRILRSYRIFSIDWFTDNKFEAPLHVTSSNSRSGINGLIEDASVSNASAGDQDVTLEQCLQLFIEPEVLGPDDKWYCPQCKEHIQAEKKMSVWRLPPILIIHLKRFKYNHYSSLNYMSNYREKIDTTIKFPIHNLDMSPYCSSSTTTDDNYSLQSRYDLYGIVNHRGSASFGHYISHAKLLGFNDPVKTEIGWRIFDDQHVSQLGSTKDLVKSDAYVLFYRHRHSSVNFSSIEQLQQLLDNSIANNHIG